jgi:hypothetical protein
MTVASRERLHSSPAGCIFATPRALTPRVKHGEHASTMLPVRVRAHVPRVRRPRARRIASRFASPAVAVFFAVGCGEPSERLVDTVGTWDPTAATSMQDAAGSFGPAIGSSIGSAFCGPEGTLIFVLDDAEVLHSFDPSLLPSPAAFQTIGPITCAEQFAGEWLAANSMAIDHSAVAWVTDHAGHLGRVSTQDGTCTPTAYQPNQPGSHFSAVGMAFAGQVSNGLETLYVADNSQDPVATTGLGLATIDVGSLELTPVGPFDGTLAGRGAELTGTGDGRLFGFFPGSPSTIAQIDPATGHIVSTAAIPLQALVAGNLAYAFSFWGGVFYTYLATGGGSTDVSTYDPASGTTTTVLSQIGFNIIGAGVSTCAPITTPR